MSKNNSHTDPRDQEAALELSRKLTSVIMYCMEYGGISQAKFAQEIGLSRSSLNQIFKARSNKHLWRLPQLCAVARALHVSVTDLFSTAEDGGDEERNPAETLAYKAMLYDTRPGSPERLQRMIVSNYRITAALFEEDDSVSERADFDVICKCTPLELEQGAPEFYKAYFGGKLDEREAEEAVRKALSYVFRNGGYVKTPLWVGFKNTFTA